MARLALFVALATQALFALYVLLPLPSHHQSDAYKVPSFPLHSAVPQASDVAQQSITCTPVNVGANGIPASFKVDASAVTLPEGASLYVSVASPNLVDATESATILAFAQLDAATDAELPNLSLTAEGALDVLEAGKTYQVTCAGAILSADAPEPAYLAETYTDFTFSG